MRAVMRRRVRALALVALALLLLLSAGLAIVNLIVLPAALGSLRDSAARRGVELELASLTYTPWAGVVGRQLRLEPYGIEASRLRLRAGLAGLISMPRAVREILSDPPAAPAPENIGDLERFAADLGSRLADLGSAVVEVSGFRRGSQTARMLSVRYRPAEGWARLSADEVVLRDGALRLDILELTARYDEGSFDLRYDLAIGPAPFGSVSSGRSSGTLRLAAEELEGEVRAENLVLLVPLLAPDPIGPVDLSYEFHARLDPAAAVPDLAGLEPLSRAALLTNLAGRLAEAMAETPPVRGVLRVLRGRLTVNGVVADVRPSLWGLYQEGLPGHLSTPRWIGVEASMPETELQVLVDAVPAAIAGPLAQTRIDGTLGLDFRLRIPPLRVGLMDWGFETRVEGFQVRSIPEKMNPYRLNDEFLHTIRDADAGVRRTVEIPAARPATVEWMLAHSEHSVGEIRRMRAEDATRSAPRPATTGSEPEYGPADAGYRYVRLDDMSRWIPAAILTAEDGDFFFYDGVNPVTLTDAIARNIEAGEVVLGASTITMQLAKMLFLDQARVFSRKLQELFLVYLMEHHVVVSKDRILELYLNLAEFGPDIYGIHAAARYYFAKDPADLQAGEAVWLASILPGPKIYHRYFEEGEISAGWFERMKGYMNTMLVRGRMSPEEYAAATGTIPSFRGAADRFSNP